MYNIDFYKYTIDELKNFEKEIHNTIKEKENEEKVELSMFSNVFKADNLDTILDNRKEN